MVRPAARLDLLVLGVSTVAYGVDLKTEPCFNHFGSGQGVRFPR